MMPNIEWDTQESVQSQIVEPISSNESKWHTTVGGVGTDTNTNNRLFLYFDESGNLDFGDKGSHDFFLTCVVSRRPFRACNELMRLYYDYLEKGLDLEHFHACEDNEATRVDVYNIIASYARDYDVYVFHVDKKALDKKMQDPAALYSRTFSWIIEEVFSRAHLENCEQVIVITDTLPKEARKREVVKPLKESLKRTFQKSNVPYVLMHHSSQSDYNLQIADYACWAAQREIVRGLDWPKKKIQDMFVGFGTITGETE